VGYDGANLAPGQHGGLVAAALGAIAGGCCSQIFPAAKHFAQYAHLCQRPDPKALQNQITA